MTLPLARTPEAEPELRRLRREVARLKKELAVAHAAKAAAEAASHEDVVTGALNRRGFLRDLERALSYARRYKTPAALLMVDLDRFKPINDRFGHEAGDLALKHVAGCLKASLRASDSLGRIGGDEFAILLWQLDAATARTKADSLEQRLEQSEFRVGGVRLPVMGSIGSTAFEPDDDVKSAMARADEAMYARKAERRALARAAGARR